MLPKDRLHVVSLMVTSMAAMFQFIAVLLPNWWILRDYYESNTVTTYSLFGQIRCNVTMCYPDDLSILHVPKGKVAPLGIQGDNAGWLMVGRVFSILGLLLVAVTMVLQLFFLTFNVLSLQVVAIAFLIKAGLVNFIASFLFLNKFYTLTSVYYVSRPPGALTYNTGGVGCILFSCVLCVVAAVFTGLAFRPPTKTVRFG